MYFNPRNILHAGIILFLGAIYIDNVIAIPGYPELELVDVQELTNDTADNRAPSSPPNPSKPPPDPRPYHPLYSVVDDDKGTNSSPSDPGTLLNGYIDESFWKLYALDLTLKSPSAQILPAGSQLRYILGYQIYTVTKGEVYHVRAALYRNKSRPTDRNQSYKFEYYKTGLDTPNFVTGHLIVLLKQTFDANYSLINIVEWEERFTRYKDIGSVQRVQVGMDWRHYTEAWRMEDKEFDFTWTQLNITVKRPPSAGNESVLPPPPGKPPAMLESYETRARLER